MTREDDVYARILAGELDPASAEARAAAARDPGLRARLDELVDVEAKLASAGRDARGGPVAGEDEVLTRFRTVARLRSAGRGRLLRLAVLTAAASLAIWFGLRALQVEPPRTAPPVHLGDGDCATPSGAVRQYGSFTWKLTLPPNATFQLVVRSMEGRELCLESDLSEARWTPDPQQSAAWPARIRWQAAVVENGVPTGEACSAEAWLDPSSPR